MIYSFFYCHSLILLLTVYHINWSLQEKNDILNQLLIIVLLHGIIFMDNILSILGLYAAF